jgi:hypothetical protein
MNLQKIENIDFDGIDHKDYPDYCDAYIVSADYDGEPLTEEQIMELNQNGDFKHDKLFEYLQG